MGPSFHVNYILSFLAVSLYALRMQITTPIDILTVALSFALQSPVDGKPMLLTPEESIQIQVGSSYPYLGFVVS